MSRCPRRRDPAACARPVKHVPARPDLPLSASIENAGGLFTRSAATRRSDKTKPVSPTRTTTRVRDDKVRTGERECPAITSRRQFNLEGTRQAPPAAADRVHVASTPTAIGSVRAKTYATAKTQDHHPGDARPDGRDIQENDGRPEATAGCRQGSRRRTREAKNNPKRDPPDGKQVVEQRQGPAEVKT